VEFNKKKKKKKNILERKNLNFISLDFKILIFLEQELFFLQFYVLSAIYIYDSVKFRSNYTKLTKWI
jgi:hypothetical protein